MSFLIEIADIKATAVTIVEGHITVKLEDGRTIITPLSWYPSLERAQAKEQQAFEILGGGTVLEWEGLDYHLSIKGMLEGKKAQF